MFCNVELVESHFNDLTTLVSALRSHHTEVSNLCPPDQVRRSNSRLASRMLVRVSRQASLELLQYLVDTALGCTEADLAVK